MGTVATGFTGADVGTARTRQEFVSEGMTLTISRVSYGKVDVDAVLDGTAAAIEIVATQDGGGYIAEWERGEGSGDAVYCERWTQDGRVFHGWIDAKTRRIVQTG